MGEDLLTDMPLLCRETRSLEGVWRQPSRHILKVLDATGNVRVLQSHKGEACCPLRRQRCR